jgi:hypothetical protein
LKAFVGTEWAGIYVLEQKAGHVKITTSFENGVFTIDSMMKVTIRAFGTTQTMVLLDEKTFDAKTDLLTSQKTNFEQGTQRIHVVLTAKGERATVTKTVADEVTTEVIARPEVRLSEVLGGPLLVRRGQATPGIHFRHLMFEAMPPYTRALEMESTFLGKESLLIDGVLMPIYRWRTKILEQDTEIDTILNEKGITLKTTMMKLMVLRAEPEAQAKSLDSVPDVLNLSMIRTNRNLGKASELESLTLKIEIDDPPDALLNSRAFVVEKDRSSVTLHIRRHEIPKTPSTSDDESRPPSTFTQPSPMIQSDHVEIVAASREIVGTERKPRKIVELVLRHVFQNVRKTYRAQLSNALDVLRNREGDCTEHTVLFVALARAAGIPARPVVGLTYTSTSGGGFGGHAWAEVYLSGKWYPVDPTANQLAADPSHIPLAVGNLEQLSKISKYIGILKIHVLALEAR